ncbi:MAG: hypothetical protein NTX03_08960 [Bacteroidetes bacterium]|nr:hypothetical protein [Bacteroidota bacterium]
MPQHIFTDFYIATIVWVIYLPTLYTIMQVLKNGFIAREGVVYGGLVTT